MVARSRAKTKIFDEDEDDKKAKSTVSAKAIK